MWSIAPLAASLIIGIIYLARDYSKVERKIPLTNTGIIVLVLMIIAFAGSIIGICNDISESEEAETKESQKLTDIAYAADGAISYPLGFMASFLRDQGEFELYNVFNETHEDESGHDRPDPSVLNPIMDVFSKAAWFDDSNMKFNGQAVSWLGSFNYDLSNTYALCDSMMKEYGSISHPLVSTIRELRNYSDNLIFLTEFVNNQPESRARGLWVNGIDNESHLELCRHFYLRVLKIQRLTRDILDGG